MSDMAPGQAAYETRRRLTAERIGEALEDFGVPWDKQTDDNRAIENAAAQAAIAAAAAAHPARGGLVSAHFITAYAGREMQLVCAHEDASDVECDETIAVVEPGNTWDEMESRIAAHAARCHPEAAAAAQPAPGDEVARLRNDLLAEVLREVELGTLGQHTPEATTRTLARTAQWRKRGEIPS